MFPTTKNAFFCCMLAATAWLAAGCERPSALVICHNSNCASPTDPFRDDTINAMRESLALRYHGRPMLDGAEIDTFWHGAADDGGGRCLFAHDLDTAQPYTEAIVAAEEIARYLENTTGEVSWNGERFLVKIELKGYVGHSYYDKHTPEQSRQHAECALDLFEVLGEAAIRAGRQIEVILDSSEPKLLHALMQSARWPGKQPDQNIQVRLSADFLDSTPSGLALQRLADFPDIDIAEFHAGWITDGHFQAFRSMGVDLTLWMFSATVETFAAIEKFRPRCVLTSEAPLVRRWLEY